MARPIKDGVDYFPLDTVMDTKFELIEAEFGLTGFAVVVKLYQKIYGEQGYYCEWTNEVALLFSRKIGEGCSVVSEIVNAAIKRGIFDKDKFEKYHILTSKGVQERYFAAVGRRKIVNVKPEYLLVQCVENSENVNINRVNVDINPENVCNNPQSKVKERKVNKSKVEDRQDEPAKRPKHRYGEYKNIRLTDEEFEKLKSAYPKSYQGMIENMSKAIEMKGYKYKSHYLALLKWAKNDGIDDSKVEDSPSYDINKIKQGFNVFDNLGW